MELELGKIRKILLDLDEAYDKVDSIPQMYLSPHMENKWEIALDMLSELDDYFSDRLNELERNNTTFNKDK